MIAKDSSYLDVSNELVQHPPECQQEKEDRFVDVANKRTHDYPYALQSGL